jgi:2-polyprenyl-3-methyl-5-hydroxy-6-metoxy-1,4-benzoquinol methylase
LKNPVCELCGGRNIAILFTKDRLNVVKCLDCSLCFVYPQESPEALAKRYSSPEYFNTKFVEKFGYGNYSETKKLSDLWFQKILAQINQIAPMKGKLLDIGCAFGYFLVQARLNGWDISGLERSPYAVEYAKKTFSLDIHQGTLEENQFSDNFFQVITLFDVIEHVISPTSALQHIHRILQPGGVLVITTPNESGLLRKIMGRHWFHFKPLEHNFFFSKESLSKYLQKNGFEIILVQQCKKIVDIEFMINRAFHYNSQLPKIVQWISGNHHWKQKPFSFPTGEIDVFARKI